MQLLESGPADRKPIQTDTGPARGDRVTSPPGPVPAGESWLAAHGGLHALFEFLPDGCVVTDLAGTVRAANRASARLAGMPRRYALGKPLAMFLAAPERARFAELLRSLGALSGEAVREWRFELRAARPGPAPVVRARVRTLCDGRDTPVGLLWLLRDCTVERELEAVLARERAERERAMRARTMELEAVVRMRDAELAHLRAALDCGAGGAGTPGRGRAR